MGQPEWGKHEIVTMEKINEWNDKMIFDKEILYENSTMIVIIKDIFTWIKSMCNANYDFFYETNVWKEHCPNYVNETKLEWIPINRASIDNPNRTSNGNFSDIIQVWNLYYHQWISTINPNKYPLVIVRFEDLLLRPIPLIQKICQCMGYNELLYDDVVIPSAAAKNHTRFTNAKSNDRASAIEKYSDPMYRFKGFNDSDIEFIHHNVNQTILELFGY